MKKISSAYWEKFINIDSDGNEKGNGIELAFKCLAEHIKVTKSDMEQEFYKNRKKIKTEVPFSHGNPSVIHQAIEMLDRQGYCVQDKVCMVIGNGEMGKVAAQALMEAGADVTVTVRQYRSGMVNIPFGRHDLC